MWIEIKHQEEKTMHKFKVKDANALTPNEVKRICEKMGFKAIFVNGKYYDYKS
jgi:hypothetical protein